MFGEPLEKSAPTQDSTFQSNNDNDNPQQQQPNYMKQTFEPLYKLLQPIPYNDNKSHHDMLSFNAEMFCRVMSLCHTVVVEKDLDAPSTTATTQKGKEKENNLSTRSGKETICTSTSSCSGATRNGAPIGFQYQAESPDEAALVQAASVDYGFQLLSRDSNSIKIACSSPSLLSIEGVSKNLKRKRLTPHDLSSKTSRNLDDSSNDNDHDDELENNMSGMSSSQPSQIEKWKVIAINKFDSDRKRMSIIVRSPPELESILFLFCKGADSTMLGASDTDDASVTSIANNFGFSLGNNNMLGMLSHLGVFPSEGLRTLVLGVRVLSEDECTQWLTRYKEASSAIKGRQEKLAQLANEIETDLHIVGATAIEDKLQEGVPETIEKLMDIGLKLWVLTGDKKETAIEIGYSTKVLTPKMRVTEIAHNTSEYVRGQLALEFMSFVKWGILSEYQLSSLKSPSCFLMLRSMIQQLFSLLSMVTRNPKKNTKQEPSPLQMFQETRQYAERLAS